MSAVDRTITIVPADLTPPGGPGLTPAEGGLSVVVMTVRSRASHSKSFGSLIRYYGRGKGLSIAAPCNNMPGQQPVPPSLRRVAPRDHLGPHLGVNRGSFRCRTSSEDLRAARQHVLRNSVAFDNLASGVTSNSGPDVRVDRVTSVTSASRNLSLYTSAATTDFRVTGFLSWRGTVADQVALKNQADTITTDPSNVLDLRTGAGALARAALATSADVDATWFESVDTSIVPTIAADGSIDMHGLFVLTAAAPAGAGAVLGANPSPTRLVVMPPVGSSVEPTDPPSTTPPTTPPTTTEPTDEPDPTQEPTEETTTPTDEPSTGAPTDDATGTPTDDGVDDSEGDDDATDDPRDDAAGPSDGELPVTGVAGGAVAAALAAVLLTSGAVLRSRREQEV